MYSFTAEMPATPNFAKAKGFPVTAAISAVKSKGGTKVYHFSKYRYSIDMLIGLVIQNNQDSKIPSYHHRWFS